MDALYDRIGAGYNFTRRADPYLSDRLCDLLSPQKGKLYLDVGCGTGNYTQSLAIRGFNFIGVDPSESMLDEARKKNASIKWLSGTSSSIPSANETFDGGIATLTIHYWTDLKESFKEIFRVLKKGSRFVVFTSTPEQMKGYWLNHYFPQLMSESIDRMPVANKIKDAAIFSGLQLILEEKYFTQPGIKDLFLYSGKFNPELYFDPQIRNGISSFALAKDRNEIEEGLKKLRSDIDGGKFEGIKHEYENDLGDYLFMVFEK